MSVSYAIRLAAFAATVAIAATQALACKCGGTDHGKSDWEVAKLRAEAAAVIFEGIPEHSELQWSVLSAKPDEWVPADSLYRRDSWPQMAVTFKVRRTYKGDLGPRVTLHTGLGGGDCGARFAPGLMYLVYGYGPNLNQLTVSMCSPSAWVGQNEVAADLRYLRNGRPTSSDLAPRKPLWAYSPAEQEKRIQANSQDFKRRYAAATGRICGTVVRENARDKLAGSVAFLSTAGYSPVDPPTTLVDEGGSFCSERLGPGTYYLYFTSASEERVRSAVYYPGVSERAQARAIEVSAGRDQLNVSLTVPAQKTYSVRGFISANTKSGLTANDVTVLLINLDGDRRTWYTEPIDFGGFLPLPNVKTFTFQNVLPGRYIAYASVLGEGWLTKKVELSVTTHTKFISIELMRKK